MSPCSSTATADRSLQVPPQEKRVMRLLDSLLPAFGALESPLRQPIQISQLPRLRFSARKVPFPSLPSLSPLLGLLALLSPPGAPSNCVGRLRLLPTDLRCSCGLQAKTLPVVLGQVTCALQSASPRTAASWVSLISPLAHSAPSWVAAEWLSDPMGSTLRRNCSHRCSCTRKGGYGHLHLE